MYAAAECPSIWLGVTAESAYLDGDGPFWFLAEWFVRSQSDASSSPMGFWGFMRNAAFQVDASQFSLSRNTRDYLPGSYGYAFSILPVIESTQASQS